MIIMSLFVYFIYCKILIQKEYIKNQYINYSLSLLNVSCDLRSFS